MSEFRVCKDKVCELLFNSAFFTINCVILLPPAGFWHLHSCIYFALKNLIFQIYSHLFHQLSPPRAVDHKDFPFKAEYWAGTGWNLCSRAPVAGASAEGY